MDFKGPVLCTLLSAVALTTACTRQSVTAVTVAAVSVTPPEVTTPEGERVPFAANVRDDRNEALEGADVAWSSDDESVVTIDQDGTARAVAPGTARVRASFRDVHGEAVITVVSLAPPPTEDDSIGGGGLEDLLPPIGLPLGGSAP